MASESSRVPQVLHRKQSMCHLLPAVRMSVRNVRVFDEALRECIPSSKAFPSSRICARAMSVCGGLVGLHRRDMGLHRRSPCKDRRHLRLPWAIRARATPWLAWRVRWWWRMFSSSSSKGSSSRTASRRASEGHPEERLWMERAETSRRARAVWDKWKGAVQIGVSTSRSEVCVSVQCVQCVQCVLEVVVVETGRCVVWWCGGWREREVGAWSVCRPQIKVR